MTEEASPATGSGAQHFVLVHGAMHGAWCLYKVRSRLESLGHRVSCLDLASAGRDPTLPNSITTLAAYIKPLVDFTSALPDHEKVVLVGHSADGYGITYCVQEFWSKVRVAVYVSAAMGLKSGGGPLFDIKWTVFYDEERPASVVLKDEYQREILYNLSPIEDSILASMLLKPSPVGFEDFVFDLGEEAKKVERTYIKTTEDNIFSLERQEQMIRDCSPSRVMEIVSDHSPFFSAPDQLAHLLLEASASALPLSASSLPLS